jgi:hypothetical protein
MSATSYVLGVVWKDPDAQKAYWYGPVHGEDERFAGEAVLRELWREKFDAGLVELQRQEIGAFPWQQEPTTEQRWGSSTQRLAPRA